MSRSEGIDWFPEEVPSKEEYQEGMDNLEQADFKVDYNITHTAPTEVVSKFVFGLIDDDLELRQYLQRVSEWTGFSAWYFGHYHVDKSVYDTYFCLYDEVAEL